MLTTLADQAESILNAQDADNRYLRLLSGGWNPNAFVDLENPAHAPPSSPAHRVCVALKQLEWRLLFDHCARAAAGE